MINRPIHRGESTSQQVPSLTDRPQSRRKLARLGAEPVRRASALWHRVARGTPRVRRAPASCRRGSLGPARPKREPTRQCKPGQRELFPGALGEDVILASHLSGPRDSRARHMFPRWCWRRCTRTSRDEEGASLFLSVSAGSKISLLRGWRQELFSYIMGEPARRRSVDMRDRSSQEILSISPLSGAPRALCIPAPRGSGSLLSSAAAASVLEDATPLSLLSLGKSSSPGFELLAAKRAGRSGDTCQLIAGETPFWPECYSMMSTPAR